MIKSLYPCFQHWSEKGSVYLISDTHFDDADRAFMGYNISEENQINILKKITCKNDTLIHLGDVGNPEYLESLKCYKVLIMGNHDQSVEKMKEYFDEVYPGPLWINQKLILSHEPIDIQSWSWIEGEGTNIVFNIHGHDHGDKTLDYYHLNICPNIYGYMPLNLGQFIKSGKLKNINDIHRVTIDNATERKINKDILKEWYTDSGVENL